ncbi:MAG: response regulator [Elusimicrobia bacterium]|nr:response regulator [Elusimicrobiota bacterium]
MTDGKKILIIDDDPEILDLLKLYFKAVNYEVIESEEGLRGLELARTQLPDLIILDILLPEISGLKMCRILKRDKETKNIPIMILTALTDEETKIESLKSYADAFISKPIDKKAIIDKVNELLTKNEEKKQ